MNVSFNQINVYGLKLKKDEIFLIIFVLCSVSYWSDINQTYYKYYKLILYIPFPALRDDELLDHTQNYLN